MTFQTSPIPIPGFQGTGDILGAGAEVEVRVTISGTEYGGFPSPLVGMTLYAPSGVKVATRGLAAVRPPSSKPTVHRDARESSRAGPTGEGLGVVSFGGERVNEKVSLQSFFAPTGGLTFYAVGTTPTSFEILEKGYWTWPAPPTGQR